MAEDTLNKNNKAGPDTNYEASLFRSSYPASTIKNIAARRLEAFRAELQREISNSTEAEPSTSNGAQAMEIDEEPYGAQSDEVMDWDSTSIGRSIWPQHALVDRMANSHAIPHDVGSRVAAYNMPLKTDYCKRPHSGPNPRYFVVDTCVYLSNLEVVKRLFYYCTANNAILVVPYQVLVELDDLKISKPQLRTEVQAAFRFLSDQRKKRTQHVVYQHPIDDLVVFTRGSTHDDSLVNCGLQVQNNVNSNCSITLVSNDSSLGLKAEAAQFKFFTEENLLSYLSLTSCL
ncbi:uncharacterized protein LOC131261340 [Anopheles coustani]|uniref:uncharacterized protein LOC131261340 n=2 Tax=coustani group TaxID=59130 RepID=UPI0026588D7B|nr:uncharacterized protein LOC131261340 [Anopheles coustani]